MSTHSDKNQFKFLKYGCLVSGGLLLCLLIAALALFIYAHQTPRLPAPFADYPNSVTLEPITAWSETEGLTYANCGEAFYGEKYKIFATTDSAEQVLGFYKEAAAKQKLVKPATGSGYVPEGYGSSAQVACFQTNSYGYERPTNVVIILNPLDPISAKVISKSFTKIPADTNLIIILLQGYTHYI
jgi:hypothetical protein